MILGKEISQCGICAKTSLEKIWKLPQFPLTEKYGEYSSEEDLWFDQELLFCNDCGHVQLRMQLPPHLLYSASEYAYRTSHSTKSRLGSQVFLDFFSLLAKGRKFQSLVDIGGNDLYLAKMVNISQRCVVDPVCIEQDGQIVDGINIIGKLFEEVDLKKEAINPDLVFCRHVLEHVAQPKELLKKLFDESHSNALYIFEIPCLENLIEANRFDAIFHQHYHYYDLFTFRRLIDEVGGEYLTHLYNRQGSCGGALLIAFQKQKTQIDRVCSTNIPQRKKNLIRAIQNYRLQMELMTLQFEKLQDPVYGYGAGLMLATFAYHLKTDFSNLQCILDDDPLKDGIGYQNIPVKIGHPMKCTCPPNSNFLITSLENARPIYRRILDFTPRRVLSPMIN